MAKGSCPPGGQGSPSGGLCWPCGCRAGFCPSSAVPGAARSPSPGRPSSGCRQKSRWGSLGVAKAGNGIATVGGGLGLLSGHRVGCVSGIDSPYTEPREAGASGGGGGAVGVWSASQGCDPSRTWGHRPSDDDLVGEAGGREAGPVGEETAGLQRPPGPPPLGTYPLPGSHLPPVAVPGQRLLWTGPCPCQPTCSPLTLVSSCLQTLLPVHPFQARPAGQ